ncbi:MAG TPA: chromophore lyase CpcT/CpeT [Allocoleopsis sp.]
MNKQLITLAHYMAGEFENKAQALENPAWFVHLHLWQRPVFLFNDDSITFYAEQANIVKLDYPYRPRIIRLCWHNQLQLIQVKYYMLKNPENVRGGGKNSELLTSLTPEDVEFLPNCTLNVKITELDGDNYHFITEPATSEKCTFNYQDNTYQVELGFMATSTEFKTYDKGINPTTGAALWGALMGPYIFTKIQNFALLI